MRKIIIEWKDTTFYNGHYKIEEIKEYGYKTLETIGYLLKNDKDKIIICCSIETTEENKVCDVYVIPKKSIIKIKYLK